MPARAGWSAKHLEEPPQEWSAALLREAAPEVGDWVTAPTWSRAHRWRYARADLATELAGPILLGRGGIRIGLAGELFARDNAPHQRHAIGCQRKDSADEKAINEQLQRKYRCSE